MATHKAATEVTIAPVAEKSGLALWVERYWKVALLLGLAATAGILYRQHRNTVQRIEDDQSWDRVLAVATEDPRSRGLFGSPADLLAVADQVRGKQAGAWALFVAATTAAEEGQAAEARQGLDRLRQEYASHPLVTQKLTFPGSETPVSAAEALASRIATLESWRQSHAALFANPEPPADAPRAVLHTDLGDIEVALYPAEAPKHVENFLKLAREGYYNDTKFHRVIPGFMIQGGDPNTIRGEASTWGMGGPEYKIPREPSTLKHFTGYLAAAKMGADTESSGSQYYITVSAAHHLDGERVVFGKVILGMDVIRSIERTPIDPMTSDRPKTPPVVHSIEVLDG
jgi:cyclophilin family peptidyl-prolyl cis-trans isomerase